MRGTNDLGFPPLHGTLSSALLPLPRPLPVLLSPRCPSQSGHLLSLITSATDPLLHLIPFSYGFSSIKTPLKVLLRIKICFRPPKPKGTYKNTLSKYAQ